MLPIIIQEVTGLKWTGPKVDMSLLENLQRVVIRVQTTDIFLKEKLAWCEQTLNQMIMGHLKSHYQLKMFLKFQKQKVSSLLFQVSILCAYMHACNEFKVPISWLGILHIYIIWNPVIRIAIYLVVRKCYLRGLFGC